MDGIRTQKVEDGAVTNYLVDSNRDYAQVIAETDTSNTVAVEYIFGDDLLAQKRAETLSNYHYDGLGSTRALSDSTGNVSDEYFYDAFGVELARTGSTVNDYLFTGEQYDAGLGNYYLRARYYDQNSGRFTQQDTWMGRDKSPITLNKYIYGNADSVNHIDPSGHMGLLDFSSTNSIMSTLTTTSIRVGSKKALNLIRKVKIYNVYTYAQWPVHFYMYVEKKRATSGIRYDVGAPGGWGNLGQQLCRGNICGRIPGFIQSSKAYRSQLSGVRTRVVQFTFGQYLFWHFTVVGKEQMECTVDITYSLVPGPNCLSWTVKATAKAIAISRMRM